MTKRSGEIQTWLESRLQRVIACKFIWKGLRIMASTKLNQWRCYFNNCGNRDGWLRIMIFYLRIQICPCHHNECIQARGSRCLGTDTAQRFCDKNTWWVPAGTQAMIISGWEEVNLRCEFIKTSGNKPESEYDLLRTLKRKYVVIWFLKSHVKWKLRYYLFQIGKESYNVEVLWWRTHQGSENYRRLLWKELSSMANFEK